MTSGPRPMLAPALSAIAGAMLVLAAPAQAQQDVPKTDAGMARAQKAADAVFHWIKLNADKGASRQAPAPAPVTRKPASAPAASAPRPVPVPTSSTTVQTPAPDPTVTTAAPEPEPEPVLLASAAPTPTPAAPMTVAERAVEPPPLPAEPVEEPLQLLVKVEPTFPRQLMQQRIQRGFAQVQFTVAPDGTVSEAQAVKSSHRPLGSAAVQAVRQWRFAPIAKERTVAVEVAFTNAD